MENVTREQTESVQPEDTAEAVVVSRWAILIERLQREGEDSAAHSLEIAKARLVPLMDALRAHPRLGKLYPFTSLATLRLSRNTRLPYSSAAFPSVRAIDNGLFRVFGPSGHLRMGRTPDDRLIIPWEHDIIGEGDVSDAVAWMDAALPPGFRHGGVTQD